MKCTHTIQRLTICLIAVLVASCVSAQRRPVFMTDNDFVEHERVYSPDKSMLILNYGIDIGAFGYGGNAKAVLKLSDMTKNLRQFDLPNGLMRVRWVDNVTISAQVDIIPSIRSGQPIEIRDTEVNGVKVKVSPYDYIDADDKTIVEHRETSPDGNLELVAYRYRANLQNIKFIHISVIKKGEPIPKYGNYFIGTMTSDHIMNGTWTKENKLLFYTNSLYADLVQYYFVHDKPDIEFEIITDDARYGSKYRWMGAK